MDQASDSKDALLAGPHADVGGVDEADCSRDLTRDAYYFES